MTSFSCELFSDSSRMFSASPFGFECHAHNGCSHSPSVRLCPKTLCPSGSGDGLEIHWALPAGVRIPSVSLVRSCVLRDLNHPTLHMASDVRSRIGLSFHLGASALAKPAGGRHGGDSAVGRQTSTHIFGLLLSTVLDDLAVCLGFCSFWVISIRIRFTFPMSSSHFPGNA